jgi:hypothetical protein
MTKLKHDRDLIPKIGAAQSCSFMQWLMIISDPITIMLKRKEKTMEIDPAHINCWDTLDPKFGDFLSLKCSYTHSYIFFKSQAI